MSENKITIIAIVKFLIKRIIPSHIKKLPIYRGCLTRLYKPFEFKESAICFFVFLPEVDFGTKPITKTRINKPNNDISKNKTSVFKEVSLNDWIFIKYIVANKYINRGIKLLFLKNQLPIFMLIDELTKIKFYKVVLCH